MVTVNPNAWHIVWNNIPKKFVNLQSASCLPLIFDKRYFSPSINSSCMNQNNKTPSIGANGANTTTSIDNSTISLHYWMLSPPVPKINSTFSTKSDTSNGF